MQGTKHGRLWPPTFLILACDTSWATNQPWWCYQAKAAPDHIARHLTFFSLHFNYKHQRPLLLHRTGAQQSSSSSKYKHTPCQPATHATRQKEGRGEKNLAPAVRPRVHTPARGCEPAKHAAAGDRCACACALCACAFPVSYQAAGNNSVAKSRQARQGRQQEASHLATAVWSTSTSREAGWRAAIFKSV